MTLQVSQSGNQSTGHSKRTWLPRLAERIQPYSIRAMGVGALCFASAVAVQVLARWAGGSVMYSTYFPAVLIAGLVGGLPAGVFVTVAALVTVWWAFIPPSFVFNPLGLNQQLDLAVFLLSSACILAVTESYRAALRQLRKQERERELVTRGLEHRGKNTYAVIDVSEHHFWKNTIEGGAQQISREKLPRSIRITDTLIDWGRVTRGERQHQPNIICEPGTHGTM